MPNNIFPRALAALAMAAGFGSALAADPPAQQTDQVVVPQVDRRDVRVPKFPSNDFEAGLFAGTYATQNFGTSAVVGVRLGYHITEDFFVEGVYAQTHVSDEQYRLILPGGIFASEKEKLSYYNLSGGWNLLPGEVFVGSRYARPSQFYLIAGVGSTKFDKQRRPTMNVGFGYRVYVMDRFALQVDMRDHIYSVDLLGKRENTQNLELTAGLTFAF